MAKVEIEVVAGCCKLIFSPGDSTGVGDTDPGVGFECVSTFVGPQRDGKWSIGRGVIGRADAARLRDELEVFLKAHARSEAA